jgi:hypothetical protein
MWRMMRRHLWPLLAWTAVCLLFFAPLLLGLARLPNGDLAAQFHSFALFQSREIAAGRLPLWSPGSYGGFPFAADTQSAVFYPPRWITLLATLSGGLSFYALQLEAIAHVWLAGVFTYCLAYDLTSHRGAGLLAATAVGLGGYLVSYPVQQLAILETIAWLPLVLLLLRRAFRPGVRAIAWLAAAAVALGLSLSAGHPQTFLQMSYLAGAYYLFLAWRACWAWSWALALGGFFLLVAAGVSAGAWLPALRYTAETTRTAVDYAFVATGFPLLDYLQTLVPGALTVWSPQYVGLAAVFFTTLAWAGRAGLPRDARAELAFWSAAALVAAWLSLGDSGILFELTHRIMPGLSLFRQQERWAGVFSLSLALVAAQGFALWWRARPGVPSSVGRRAAVGVTAGLSVAGVVLLAANAVAVAGWEAVWARQWLLLGVLLAVVLLGPRLARPASVNPSSRHVLAGLVLLLLAADLFLATRPTMHLVTESPAAFWPQPAWMTTLQGDAPGRIDSQNLFVANVGEAYALEDIRGISPLKPRAIERYEQLPRPLRWRLLNVTHVIAPEAIEPGLSPLAAVTQSVLPGETLAATLYRVDDPLPRAWAVAEAVTAASDEAALETMTRPGFDPARQVVLSGELPDELPGNAPAPAPQVTVSRLAAGLDIIVGTAAPVVVVISEWQRDGWRATLDDGTVLPILRANAGLSAVVVPAGSHTVSLRFRPWDVWLGLVISLAAVLAAVVAAWRWRPVVVLRPAARPVPDTPVPVRSPQSVPLSGSLSTTMWRAALVAILLVGFSLRVVSLGAQELRGDEAFSYLFTRLPLGEVVPELIDQGDPHPPLHYLALNVWARLAGDSELALRYLSAMAGTLLLPVLAVLGRRMAGARAGLWAAGLAAAAPGLIWLSQDVRNQYALVMLFAALTTLALVRRPLPGRGRVAYWMLYALLAALTVYNHYYGVFALLSHGLYLWATPNRRRDLAAWTLSGAAVLLALVPWLLLSSGNLLGAGQLSDPSQPELARHLAVTGAELLVGQSLPFRIGRWLFLGAALVAGAGGVSLLRRRVTAGWGTMLLGWLAFALVGTYLVRFSRATFNPFYIAVAAPAWWLLISAELVALWQGRPWQRVVAVAAPALLAAVLIAGLSDHYTNPTLSRTLGYRAVAEHLAAKAGSNDVFIDHFPDPVWDYYLRDVPISRSLQPAQAAAPAAETEASLAALAAAHDRLWFVPYIGSVWDLENVVGRWLDYHLLTEESRLVNRHRLAAYRALPAAPAIMTPQNATTDDIALQAAYVTVDGRPVDLRQPVPLPPGASVAVTLLWEATATPAADYTVFVHVLDSAGALVAQHDGTPQDGTRPTSAWVPGERLLDRHTLTVPAGRAGEGQLIAGLYDSATIARQPFRDGRDAVTLAPVVLARPAAP